MGNITCAAYADERVGCLDMLCIEPAAYAITVCSFACCAPRVRVHTMEHAIAVYTLRFYRPTSFYSIILRDDKPVEYIAHFARDMRTARRALMLGLGGGALPHALRTLDFRGELVVVDVDERIIAIARQYVPDGDGFVYEHATAEAYVRNAPDASFDVVANDVYVEADMPASVIDRAFVRHVFRILAPGGTYLVNVQTCAVWGGVKTQIRVAKTHAVQRVIDECVAAGARRDDVHTAAYGGNTIVTIRKPSLQGV